MAGARVVAVASSKPHQKFIEKNVMTWLKEKKIVPGTMLQKPAHLIQYEQKKQRGGRAPSPAPKSQHQSRHHRPHRRQHRMEPQVERGLRHHQQLRLEMPMEAMAVLQEGTCCPRLAMWPCRAILQQCGPKFWIDKIRLAEKQLRPQSAGVSSQSCYVMFVGQSDC